MYRLLREITTMAKDGSGVRSTIRPMLAVVVKRP
jgi:hypothetical protein